MGLNTSPPPPRFPRAPATLLLGLVGVAIVYLGAFAFDAISLVSAFVVILTIITAPWMVILIMGHIWRRGIYDPRDLQVFNAGLRGGRYWFSGGWNLRAFAAWIPAVLVGFLMAHTTEYTGPWADWANGIDISIPVAMVIAAVIYAIALRVFVEPPEVLGEAPASEPVHESSLAAALAAPIETTHN
jgi:purine-cytosine permease-like protein